MDACSAACAAPGMSGASMPASSDDGLGQGPPHAVRAQLLHGHVEQLLAEVLAVGSPALEGDDLRGDVDGAAVQGARGVRVDRLDDADVAHRARERRVVDLLLDHGRHRIVEVETRDDVADALMDVDRAAVHDAGCRRPVDGAEQSARAVLHDPHRRAPAATQVGEIGGALAAGPEPAAGASTEHALVDEVVDDRPCRRAEPLAQAVVGERQLGRCCAQVRREHVAVARIEDARLDVEIEHHAGVVGDVRVERIVAGDEDAERLAARPPGAAELLPHARAGAGPPRRDHHVEPAHVDPHLERVGRRERAHAAVAQPGLELASLLRAGSRPGRRRPRRRVRDRRR